MLSNAYFLAKFRFDTAENEPAKNLQFFSNFTDFPNFSPPEVPLLRQGRGPAAGGGRRRDRRAAPGRALRLPRPAPLAENLPILQIFGKCCSFSAVSAPIFAIKYAFCSIFQDLPEYLPAIFEIWQNFVQILQLLQNVAEFSQKLLIFQTDFLLKF